jgi:hypothetical protein
LGTSGEVGSAGTLRREIEKTALGNNAVFPPLLWTGKRRKIAKRPHFTKSDTTGEVIFTTASTLTHQVFNGLPNMNRAHFRLCQQYCLSGEGAEARIRRDGSLR